MIPYIPYPQLAHIAFFTLFDIIKEYLEMNIINADYNETF